jgi:hypothetical protein
MRFTRRWFAVLLVTIAAVIGALILVAPSASATCTGSPGCDSGWRGITVYDASSGENFNVNIDIHWTADSRNTRTFYFSGSTCFPNYPYQCHGFSYMALYYRVHCSTCKWISIEVANPGPPYGSYYYDTFDGWNYAHDFVVAGCSFGRCVNSPTVLN